jgi:quercetin dioxygenase-like cupin family protein
MKWNLLIGTILSVFIAADLSMAQEHERVPITDDGPEHHLIYPAGEIEWQDAPASLEPGGKVAILEGNPSEAGVFTMRIRMPDGYYISPHWHPNVERVTVISGNFLLGSGDRMDREATERLKPGSYTSMPPGMRHFAIADGETVIQLTSVGPWIINYIHEEDDPRLRQ